MNPDRMIRMDLENLWKEGLNLKARRPDCPSTESICGILSQTQRTVLAQLEKIKAQDQLAQGIGGCTMTIDRQKEFWTRASVKADTERYYLFGDNEAGTGKGGQAVIRGLPNAFGIPTKRSPSEYWSDETFEDNCRAIDAAWLTIPTDRPWVISHEGLGTGLSELPTRAPRTYQYLLHKVTSAEYADYRLPEGWGLFLRTHQFTRRGNHDKATSFVWPESGLVEALDWQPTRQCGFGLHGVLWGAGGTVWSTDALWCVFAAPLDLAINLDGKHKVPYGIVVYHGTQGGASDFMARYAPSGTLRNYATATQGDWSTATQGDRSTATQGNGSTATQGDWSTATQGDWSTATQGDRSVRFVRWWDSNSSRWRGMVAEVFAEDADTLLTPGAVRLDPDKTYRFESGVFTEVTESGVNL